MKNLAFLIALVLLSAFPALADVPPDKGRKRVRIDLVTETAEDLSDYRFFLDFYGDLREVEINSKGRTTIPPMGGGARYASGTFLAIPKKNLSGFEAKLSREQLEKLSESISGKKIEGVVELAKHRFSMDIPEKDSPPEIYYQIKRDGETLKADKIEKEQPKSNSSPSLVSMDSRLSYIAAGTLITLAVLLAGVFAFRKAARKS